MLSTVLTSAAAYAATNMDDIFMLMLFFSHARSQGRIAAGHCTGVALLTLLSLLGASGLAVLPWHALGLLGLVPIALGVRCLLSGIRPDGTSESASPLTLWSMAAVTLGNGADNLGVYIPLFTGFTTAHRLAAVVVFALMTALWLFLARRLSGMPGFSAVLRRCQPVLTPVVLILLGVFILLSSLQG